MPKPNTSCEVCKTPFYASPKHLEKGWGKTCSIACRSKLKPNPRFIENDVNCKHCGKSFHVKPTSQRNRKARVYCSDSCRIAATNEKKNCPQCKNEFVVAKSHAHKRKYCSKKCQHDAALCSKPNSVCKSCGKDFYTKPSSIARKIGNGAFCSVKCMSQNRGKIKLDDNKFASHLEAEMLLLIRAHKLDEGMVREYKFHPKRKWLLDFAWPELKIGIEVHGGIWNGKSGGHTSGQGRMRDMEKMNEAKILGWTIIEVASNHMKDGKAIDWLQRILVDYKYHHAMRLGWNVYRCSGALIKNGQAVELIAELLRA